MSVTRGAKSSDDPGSREKFEAILTTMFTHASRIKVSGYRKNSTKRDLIAHGFAEDEFHLRLKEEEVEPFIRDLLDARAGFTITFPDRKDSIVMTMPSGQESFDIDVADPNDPYVFSLSAPNGGGFYLLFNSLGTVARLKDELNEIPVYKPPRPSRPEPG